MQEITHSKDLINPHENSDTAIVFVHGYNSSWFFYKDLLEQLYNDKYSVYGFDLPNHGANKSVDDGNVTFEDLCDYAATWVKKNVTNKKIILIGHSLGGAIVALIASSLSNITKIILIDPLQAGIKSNLPVIGLKAMLKSNTNNNELSPLTLDHKGYNFLLSLVTEGTLTKIKHGLNSIACPLFVLFGEDDELIPASKSLVYINVEASHAQYLCTAVIPGANHSPVLTHFKQSYEKMLQFLKI